MAFVIFSLAQNGYLDNHGLSLYKKKKKNLVSTDPSFFQVALLQMKVQQEKMIGRVKIATSLHNNTFG